MSLASPVRLPRRRGDGRLVARTLRRVYARPAYVAVALVGAWACLTAVAVARNPELFVRLVVGGRLPLEDRLTVLAAMYPFGGLGYELGPALATVTLAGLVGVDLGLLAFAVRERGLSFGAGASGSAGLTGALLGGLGAGCAVCGTSLLAGALSLAGITGVAVALPFDGLLLTLPALVLVALSGFWLVDGLDGGPSCGRAGADA